MIRRLRQALALTALSIGLSTAFAQSAPKYPDRPITLLVPYAPGGAADTMARLAAKHIGEKLGQQVVVENKPGASGVIASQQLLRLPADGYTTMLVVNTHAINSAVLPKLPYDAAKDFAPIGTFARSRFLLATHPNVQGTTYAEFVATAKKAPGGLAYGTIGSAGFGRLVGETFGVETGVPIRHIPYKGSAPMLTDFISGQVDYIIDTANVYLQHIETGKVRPLAISGDSRHPALPNVPTFKEVGLPQFDPNMWFALLARTGTPTQAINTLSAELRRIAENPEVRQSLSSQAIEPYFTTPAQFGKLLSDETDHYAKIVRRVNIKSE
jgi:tripartite-type tricarboxylate transporter receptor subunit TctC